MIYIASPTSTATGGTELLQQLCEELRVSGACVKMLYTERYEGSPVEKKFSFYGNPYEYSAADEETNCVIVSEVDIDYLKRFRNIQKVIWWLSVDNYRGASSGAVLLNRETVLDCLRRLKYLPKHFSNTHSIISKSFHLYQSEYAHNYITEKLRVSADSMQPLSDYIDPRYLIADFDGCRDDVVLYNPKKGAEITRKLVAADDSLSWVPLSGYDLEGMLKRFRTAKVYVDFGNHPGKDRMPREAAACGCCIVVGKRGSACNDIDIPIPDNYKFGIHDLKSALKTIHSCIDEYEVRKRDFLEYRKKIRAERAQFNREVSAFFENLKNRGISKR